MHIILIRHCFFLRLSSLYMTLTIQQHFNQISKQNWCYFFFNSSNERNFIILRRCLISLHCLITLCVLYVPIHLFFTTTTARTYSTSFVYHKFSRPLFERSIILFSVQREVISLIWRSFCRQICLLMDLFVHPTSSFYSHVSMVNFFFYSLADAINSTL